MAEPDTCARCSSSISMHVGSARAEASADRSEWRPPRAPRLADDCQQTVGVSAVRPHGAHQHHQPARTRAPASSASRGRIARWRCRWTATAGIATSIPIAARCWRWPKRRGTWRAPARDRSARPTVSISATLNGRTSCGSSRRRSKASAPRAARSNVPITGGNVSLYNETDGHAIYPTPTIGVVGLLEHADRVVSRRFRRIRRRHRAARRRSRRAGRQRIPQSGPRSGPRHAAGARSRRRARAAGAAGDARRRAAGPVGARLFGRRARGHGGGVLLRDERHRRDDLHRRAVRWRALPASTSAAALFGESASRVVVSVAPEELTRVIERAAAAGCRREVIGQTGGNRLRIAVAGQVVIDATRSTEAERVWSKPSSSIS